MRGCHSHPPHQEAETRHPPEPTGNEPGSDRSWGLKTPAYLGGCPEAVRVIIKIVAMPHFPPLLLVLGHSLCARLTSVSASHVLVISPDSHGYPAGCTVIKPVLPMRNLRFREPP